MEKKDIFLCPSGQRRIEIIKKLDKEGSFLERFRLGRSLLGEDIDCFRFGSGEKRILYVGAHHGSEHITASLLYYFLFEISRGSSKIYGIDTELYRKSYYLYVIPLLNPDGVELSLCGAYENPLSARQARMCENGDFLHWQANARGVDLNHNYSYGFSEYKKIETEREIRPGRSLYSGEYPESEPETRALCNLFRSLEFSAVLSLHSQGEEIYCFPNEFSTRDNKDNKGRKISSAALRVAKELSADLGYKISTPTDTACYGGLCDFSGNELGIPSLTLEVGRGENPINESEYFRIRERLSRALFMIPTTL